MPRQSKAAVRIAAMLVVLVASARTGLAQERASAGASLVGTWRLDPYLSDHPAQVAMALRYDTGEAGVEELLGGIGQRGGGRSGRGGTAEPGRGGTAEPGRGGSEEPGRGENAEPGRGGAGRGPSRPELSEADRKILTELTDAVRTPPTTLTISQEESGFTIATGAKAPEAFRTNGKSEKLQLTAGMVERTATREGPNLIVSYDADRAGTVTYTFAPAPTTGQLVVRITYTRHEGEPGPFAVKLVYNPATPPAASR